MKEKYKELPVQVKASVCFFVCSFLQKGIATLTTPIFTRLMSTTEYGQYSIFNSWMDIIAIFVTLRLSYGVYSQGLVKFENDRNKFCSSMQGLNVFLCCIWLIIYMLWHNKLNRLLGFNSIQMISMFVLMWTTAVFDFWSAEQRVRYKYKLLVCVSIMVSIIKPVLGIIAVKMSNDKVTARILSVVFVEVIFYTGLFIKHLYKGKFFFSKEYWKYAMIFNLPLIPHYLSQTLLNSADRIMISQMVGEDSAGIYSLAYSLALLMTLINNALSNTMNPWIYKKIKDERTDDIHSVAYVALIIIAICNILLIAFAPEAVKLFAPKSYYNAIWVIPPVAMSTYFMFMYDLFAKFEFYYEQTVKIMLASATGATLNIILNSIFIPIFGYYAAGYTTLVCFIVYALLHYIFMWQICQSHKQLGKIYDLKILLKITCVFLAISFLYLFTYKSNTLRYGYTILLMIIIFKKRRAFFSYLKIILNMKK